MALEENGGLAWREESSSAARLHFLHRLERSRLTVDELCGEAEILVGKVLVGGPPVEEQHLPCAVAHNAVGSQVVFLLEGLHGIERAWAEVAVGLDVMSYASELRL